MRRSIVAMLVVVLLLSSLVAFAQDGGESQANKEAVQNAIAETQDGNWDELLALYPDQFQMNPGEPYLQNMSSAEAAFFLGQLQVGMPDLAADAHTIIAQDDWVVMEFIYAGTFTETMNFFGAELEPTGEVLTWTEMDFIRFEDGQIAEQWTWSDPTIMLSQFGFFPPMGDDMDTPAESPVGYETLSEDELAATYTSGNEERNLALFQEMLDAGLLVDHSASYTETYVSWQSGVPYVEDAVASSQEGMAFFGLLASAMPDMTVETIVVVAEGDWVAALVQISGTFTEDADFFGTTLTATDEPIVWQFGVINLYDADGNIVEEFVESDQFQLLGALGLMGEE